jgi:hypothetical protein
LRKGWRISSTPVGAFAAEMIDTNFDTAAYLLLADNRPSET